MSQEDPTYGLVIVILNMYMCDLDHLLPCVLCLSGQTSKVAHLLSFYPWGLEVEFISLYGQRFLIHGLIFKIAIFGHETLALKRFQKLHIYSLSALWLKLSLFSFYGQWFRRYGPIFIIAIFGHESWPLTKVTEVSNTLSFYPRGRN